MLGGQYLRAVESEGKLEIDRLFGPQGAVVVKGGDTLGGGHEVGRALLRHTLNESDDVFLGCRVVPRRQRLLGEAKRCPRYRYQCGSRIANPIKPIRFHGRTSISQPAANDDPLRLEDGCGTCVDTQPRERSLLFSA